jgi:hypothetical protein
MLNVSPQAEGICKSQRWWMTSLHFKLIKKRISLTQAHAHVHDTGGVTTEVYLSLLETFPRKTEIWEFRLRRHSFSRRFFLYTPFFVLPDSHLTRPFPYSSACTRCYTDRLCLRSEDAFVITCVANLMEVKVLYIQQDLR